MRNQALLTALLLATFACSACGNEANSDENPGKKGAKASSSDEVVVVIDGREVRRDAYEDVLYDRFAENHLESFIEEQLVAAKAKEMGVTADNAVIDAEVKKNVETLLRTRFGGSEAGLRQALIQRGMTLEGWKKELRAKATRANLIDQMIKSTRNANSESVHKRFEHKYGVDGKKYRVRHILVSTKVINSRFYPKSEYEKEKAAVENESKELGKSLLVQLTGGADFEALAKEHSDDFTSGRGGSLGEAWKGRFGKAFDDTVGRLTVGKPSGLIRGRRGYHIVEVTKINRGIEYSGSAILIGTAATGPLDKRDDEKREADAQAKLAKIKKQLDEGKAFADVAKEMSEDTSTKTRGGELGTFGRRRLGKEVDAVLEKTKAGTITEPIKSQRGYWVVKLDRSKLVPAKDRRVVRHIFLSTEYDDIKKKRLEGKLEGMAEAKAKELLAKVQAGEDFKKLATDNTEDAYTRKAGGEYYNYRRTSLGPEVWEVVQKLAPGKDASLVKSKRGFHVVQVLERNETRFEDVRDKILAEMAEVAVSPADVSVFVEGLKKEAKVSRKITPDPAPPVRDPSSQPSPHGDKYKKSP